MKKLVTKKAVLLVSFFGLLGGWALLNPLFFHICMNVSSYNGYTHCEDDLSGTIGGILIFNLTIPFLLSLLTYWMHDEIFTAWWSFARWLISINFLITSLILLMPHDGGFFNMDGLIFLLIPVPLYAILTLVSLWKIVRTYLKLKKA